MLCWIQLLWRTKLLSIVVRRIVLIVPTLLVLSMTVFVLMALAPGDATDALLDDANTDAARTAICIEVKCDVPLLNRYLDYLDGILRGDLGVSTKTGRPVTDEIAIRLPYTLTVAAAALTLALVVGISMGTLAAMLHNTVLDVAITSMLALTAATPTFWIALILVTIFSVHLHWLPVFGVGSTAHYVLPVVSVAISLLPGIARITRSSLLETISRRFVTVAAAKGLSGQVIYWRHIRPVAAIPILTYIGLQAVHLITGLITIEIVFNLPGLGGLAVQAALDRDIMLLQGVVMVIAVLAFAVLFFVDFAVMLLDPRTSIQPK
jgi:peptide/nickel transport system permease protein